MNNKPTKAGAVLMIGARSGGAGATRYQRAFRWKAMMHDSMLCLFASSCQCAGSITPAFASGFAFRAPESPIGCPFHQSLMIPRAQQRALRQEQDMIRPFRDVPAMGDKDERACGPFAP